MTLDSPKSVGDLALGALLGLGVDVGGAGEVLRQAGVGDRVGELTAGGVGRVGPALDVSHALAPFRVVRAVWEAIQIAKPTRTPMPASQANRPSLTGPREPS